MKTRDTHGSGQVGSCLIGSNKLRFSVGQVGSGPNSVGHCGLSFLVGRLESISCVSAWVTSKIIYLQ